MNKKIIEVLLLVLIALSSLTMVGCGKNIIGPSEPTQSVQIIDQNEDSPSSIEDAVIFTDSCRKNKFEVINLYWKYFNHLCGFYVKHIAKFVVKNWFQDEGMYVRFCEVIDSPIFHVVLFKCGVAQLLLAKGLGILMDVWRPGLNSNPRNCTPEITLLPYRWDFNQGFYGERMPGWGNGHGYHLEATTAENDIIGIQAVSTPLNVFNNEIPIYNVFWNYTYSPHEYEAGKNVTKYLRIEFMNSPWEKRFYVNDLLVCIDAQRIIKQDIWFSTEDKSGRCRIVSNPEVWLDIDLNFDAAGNGGGYVKIINWRGQIDTYEFKVLHKGHGYYTKNCGRKHYF